MAAPTNRLIHESSPYLLQHAHNPVDWHPWGDEAFAQAQKANKPIFLSIGYATCHWCHVMEHESFEDPQVAEMLNNNFISIKVDREERPDIDAVYMAACHLVTGSGGWPLTIIMTPDRKPFFAGTYLPKTSRFGRTGLMELGQRVTELWHTAAHKVMDSAAELVDHMARHFSFVSDGSDLPDKRFLVQTAQQIGNHFDHEFGGFETAPKFPTPHRLIFLLNVYEQTYNPDILHMVRKTLTAMRHGGIWDHVGFGFHRYATDRQWLVPHFEKMLYDQAWLAMAYLKAYRLTGEALFEETVRDIFTYVLREMTDPMGGFYTARDADSEGQEGKYYVWTWGEFESISMSEEQKIPWLKIFNLQREGNFQEEATRRKTGDNILHLARDLTEWAKFLNIPEASFSSQWQNLRARLYEKRSQRTPPLKDDKILSDWNGMMIAALASGFEILEDPAYLQAAEKSADFILDRMTDDRKRLLHRCREGKVGIDATANDYAFFIMGLLALAQVNQKDERLSQAVELQETMNELFWDERLGGFFLTARDRTDLPVRPKEIYDGAVPSANSVTLNNLTKLFHGTVQSRWRDQANVLYKTFAGDVAANPAAYTHMLDGLTKIWQVR